MKTKGQKRIEAILKEKHAYDAAKEAGDPEGMDAARKAAAGEYRALEKSMDPKDRAAGEALQNADAGQAEEILYRYATDGKAAVRDYMGEALKKEGLSFEQKDLTYDDQSGEVRYKGVSMGVPDYVSAAGVSYADREAIDDFVKNELAGTPKSEEYYRNAHSREALRNSQSRSAFLESLTDGSFRQTVGQDIMEHYRYDGKLSAADELADAASASAGNPDSFGAANASRQELAYRAAGDRAVRDEIAMILGGYSAAAEEENSYVTGYGALEEKKEASRRADRAQAEQTTGTASWAYYNDPAVNPYLNPDKTAKAGIRDYAERMEELRTKLDGAELSLSERRRLTEEWNFLNAARNAKMETSSVAMESGRNHPYAFRTLPTQSAAEAETESALKRMELENGRYGLDVGKDIAMAGYGSDVLTALIDAYTNERIAQNQLEAKRYDTDMNAYIKLLQAGMDPALLRGIGRAPEKREEDSAEQTVTPASESANADAPASVIDSFVATGLSPENAGKQAYELGYSEQAIAAYLKERFGIDWQAGE